MRTEFRILAFFLAIGCGVLSLYIDAAHAGGITVENVTFDGDPNKVTFEANKPINLKFNCRGFRYAGKPYSHVVFELIGDTDLDNIITWISHREAGNKKEWPDCSVGKTCQFATLIPQFDDCSGQVEFRLPDSWMKYELRYHVVPFFSEEPIPPGDPGQFLPQKVAEEIRLYYIHNAPNTERLARLKSTSSETSLPPSNLVTIYWKDRKEQIDDAIKNNLPPTFEWAVGDDSSKLAKDIKFAYRLDPLEDWSSYSRTQKTTYYFLTPGNYTFKVKAKYKVKGKQKETAEATYPVKVTKVISRPTPLDLSPLSPSQLEYFRQQPHYFASRALLIGVSEYSHYQALPWVRNDVGRFNTILKQHGFSTQIVESSTSFEKMRAAMVKFIDDSKAGERVIVYFSGHGGAVGLKNFLAPSDCNPQTTENCIHYDMLQQWITQLSEEKKVKHLLVIVDACQAGLGLYSKSSSTSSLEELAKYRGAHMMTAGLMGQNAQIDVEKQTSVFTEMLTKGLEGQADLIKDKVLTLSELLAFVQGGVSQHIAKINPNEQQTPNMGKVRGAGEMLFFLRP